MKGISIGELIAELESDPDTRRELEQARRWYQENREAILESARKNIFDWRPFERRNDHET